MASELQVGTLARFTARELAERVAERLTGMTGERAVCICPRGIVTIEQYDDAVPDDVVGVYSGDRGLIATYRDVRDDLVHAVQSRDVQAATRRYVRRAA